MGSVRRVYKRRVDSDTEFHQIIYDDLKDRKDGRYAPVRFERVDDGFRDLFRRTVDPERVGGITYIPIHMASLL